MITAEDRKFGELLIKRGVVTQEQLYQALIYKKYHGEDLSQILVEKRFADAKDVYRCLADNLNLPFVELHDYSVDPNVLNLVPRDLLFDLKAFPLFRIEDTLTVAMAHPTDVHAIDRLHRETGLNIEPVVCVEQEILAALEQHGGGVQRFDSTLDEAIEDFRSEHPEESERTSSEKLKELSAEAPVVRLVNLIITQAIADRASDIHIEPEEDSLVVRYRIDGILHESLTPPKELQAAIISRIKILAELDIAESRIPQDGRFRIQTTTQEVDIRVSTLPTVYGENVVMRILDRGSLTLNLEDLGFEPDTYERFRTMLSSSYGVILVSGPTGSGKTTTLYSALQALNTPEKNIVTIEDPVEYRLRRIRQTHVNPKAGLTFAAGLRSILRQDPDIIMVGEIRDSETAKIAVESALTGHLVLSTIHTNDAPGALTRLTEMGVEPFLTASATVGILAQRLVRKLCEQCKRPVQPNPTLLQRLKLPAELQRKEVVFYRGVGCQDCRNTGYKGRIGIYEDLLVNEEVRTLTLREASSDEIKRAALRAGMRTLRGDGLLKARKGLTSLEEVLRVTNAD